MGPGGAIGWNLIRHGLIWAMVAMSAASSTNLGPMWPILERPRCGIGRFCANSADIGASSADVGRHRQNLERVRQTFGDVGQFWSEFGRKSSI